MTDQVHVATTAELDAIRKGRTAEIAVRPEGHHELVPRCVDGRWLRFDGTPLTCGIQPGDDIAILEDWQISCRSIFDQLWVTFKFRYQDLQQTQTVVCNSDQWAFMWRVVEAEDRFNVPTWWPAVFLPPWAARYRLRAIEVVELREIEGEHMWIVQCERTVPRPPDEHDHVMCGRCYETYGTGTQAPAAELSEIPCCYCGRPTKRWHWMRDRERESVCRCGAAGQGRSEG